MRTKKYLTFWLRLSYWSAALADFYIGIVALFPHKMGVESYVYPMGLFSAVAISWGIMLLISDRKPIERKWVILPTIIVVTLINVARIYAIDKDLVEFSPFLLALGIMILCILVYTYIVTRKLAYKH
jgi:hypothetical protein